MVTCAAWLRCLGRLVGGRAAVAGVSWGGRAAAAVGRGRYLKWLLLWVAWRPYICTLYEAPGTRSARASTRRSSATTSGNPLYPYRRVPVRIYSTV